jgi:hypothetical protein
MAPPAPQAAAQAGPADLEMDMPALVPLPPQPAPAPLGLHIPGQLMIVGTLPPSAAYPLGFTVRIPVPTSIGTTCTDSAADQRLRHTQAIQSKGLGMAPLQNS